MLAKQLALAVACGVIAMPSSEQDEEIKQVVIKASDAYITKNQFK